MKEAFHKTLGNCTLCHSYGALCSVSISLSNIPFKLFFPGVASKLDYIKDLGVGVISLSPDYEDDGTDGDFHIKNHMKIAGSVGGDDALQRLITQAHGKGSIKFSKLHIELWFISTFWNNILFVVIIRS